MEITKAPVSTESTRNKNKNYYFHLLVPYDTAVSQFY